MKKNLKKIMVLSIPVMLGIASLASCSLATPSTSSQEPTEEDLSYVALNINPEIELFVNGDDVVVNVYGVNEDAQVLLCDEEGIEGESLEDAIDKIISLSIELGFINEDNHTISTQVSSDDESIEDKIKGSINSRINVATENLGFEVETNFEASFSTLRELEAFKNKYPDNEVIQALTVEKFRLALRASESGEITLEAAVLLDDSKLIDMINDATDKIAKFTNDLLEEIKAIANYTYEKAEIAVENLEIAKFYATRMLTNPTTAYYGSVYQVYNLSANTIDALIDVIEACDGFECYELTDAQIQEILDEAGLEGVTKEELQDLSGKVTIESVEEYLNKIYKNLEDAEDKKAEMIKKMQEIADEIYEETAKISEEYKEDIMTILDECDSIISKIKLTIPSSLHEFIDAELKEFKEVHEEIASKLEDGSLTLEELEEIEAKLDEKAEEVKDKIEEDLTDEEEEKLEENIEKALATIKSLKETTDKTIEDAEESVHKALQELKEALKNKKTEE